MKVFLSLIALFSLIAITDIALSPSANAATVTTGIHALKSEQTGVAKKAYYRRGYGYGYGVHRRCWWRYGRRICRW